MTEPNGFVEFDPIFGDATPEPEGGAAVGSVSRFSLFYVHLLDSTHLQILASDFHSQAFGRVLTVPEIDDLRDETGVSGSQNDFVHYLLASLSIGDVKLIIDDSIKSQIESSAVNANLVARKAKGLPRVSLTLNRLVGLQAKDATASISLALFKAYKNKHNDTVKEQENSSRLTELLSSERDRSNNLQKQLDALTFSSKRKVAKTKDREKPLGTKALTVFEADQTSVSAESPPPRDAQPLKGNQRAVPAFRRAKARGAALQINEDDDEK